MLLFVSLTVALVDKFTSIEMVLVVLCHSIVRYNITECTKDIILQGLYWYEHYGDHFRMREEM